MSHLSKQFLLLFSVLLCKYTLKCLDNSLLGVYRLLNWLNRLLLYSRIYIILWNSHSSLAGRLNILGRFRFFLLFLDRHQNWSSHEILLLWRLLLCSTMRVILILVGNFVNWGLYGRLNSWRRSCEVDRLFYQYVFCSMDFKIKMIFPYTRLPVLKVAWQHDAAVWCLRLVQLVEEF